MFIIPIFRDLSRPFKRKVIDIFTVYLEKNEKINELVISTGLDNVHLLPKSLQLQLIKRMYNMESLGNFNLNSIFDNYERIPVPVRVKLIDSVIERKEYNPSILNHYDQLPKLLKEKVVEIMSNSEHLAIDSIHYLILKYDQLPKLLKEKVVEIIST